MRQHDGEAGRDELVAELDDLGRQPRALVDDDDARATRPACRCHVRRRPPCAGRPSSPRGATWNEAYVRAESTVSAMARCVLSYAAELGPSDRDPARAAGSAERRTLGWETVLLLGVSLGASAIWSVLSIIEKLTRDVPLRSQTTAMNQSATPGPALARPRLPARRHRPRRSCRWPSRLPAVDRAAPVHDDRGRAVHRLRPDRAGPRPAPRARAGGAHRAARVWGSTSSPRRSGSTRPFRRPTSPTCGGPGPVLVARGHRQRPARGGRHGRLPLHPVAADRVVVAGRHRPVRADPRDATTSTRASAASPATSSWG